MSFKDYFPDFELDVVIPEGFVDMTDPDYPLPTFVDEKRQLAISIDYKNRENRIAPACERFSLLHWPPDDEPLMIIESENYHDILQRLGPDFELDVVIPEGFVNMTDPSYPLPIFVDEKRQLAISIDYKNREDRIAPACERFGLLHWPPDDEPIMIIESENYHDILQRLEVYKDGRSYSTIYTLLEKVQFEIENGNLDQMETEGVVHKLSYIIDNIMKKW